MKRRISTIIAVILLISVRSDYGIAQDNAINFNLVEGNNGEPLGRINAITQDPNGYMWFSGQGNRCLYKYDGVRMIAYKPGLLQNPAFPNYLETVYADPSGMIWLGFVNGGMEQFDPVTGIFKQYLHDSADLNSLSEGMVSAILRDHLGRLWVGTANGLDQLDEKTGKFIHYRNEPANPTSLSSSVVRTIYEDREGVLWVGTGFEFNYPNFPQYIGPDNGGLNRMDAPGKFTRFIHDPKNPNSLINNKIKSIFEDSRGIFWVGTSGDGLHTMDRSTGTFIRHTYDPHKPEQLSRPVLKEGEIPDPITFIREDAIGAIWIGTYLSGVNRYDPVTKKITHYESSNGYPDKNCWAAYESRDGVLWLSSTDPVGFLYRVIPETNKIRDNTTVNFIWCLQEDKQGFLWASGWRTGLLQFDKNDKLVAAFKRNATDSVDLSTEDIRAISQNGPDSLWLCTSAGLIILNKKTKLLNWLRYERNADSPAEKFRGRTVLGIIDIDGLKWFSTPNGLFQFNAKNQSLKEYQLDLKDTTGTRPELLTGPILAVGTEDVWTASTNGIFNLNIHTSRFRHIMKGIEIKSLYKDSEGSVWAGSSGHGLFRFNKVTARFDVFFDPQLDIGKETVVDIIEDDLKNLWIITKSFIVKLDPDRRGSFIYGKKYGIRPNTLYQGGICKTANGKILVGNARGFYAISPNDMTENSKPLQINITEFLINNHTVYPGKNSVLRDPIDETNKILLQYNENNFSFYFAAVDYHPEGNRYYTMLENYDSTWREAGVDKSAFYLNIPPGKYVFRVKAINIDNATAEKSIEVIINPPWWKTWWAYTIYILLLLIAILGVHRLQKQRTIRIERQKAQVKELAQAKEIEKAYTQLETAHENLKSTQAQLIQSEKMASLGELTAGIAHEIQNPLNFVNNFSEVNNELINELVDEASKGNLDGVRSIANNIKDNGEKINHHGRRADSIVKGMLQHSRTGSGQKEPTDINALADEYLRLAYHGFRAKDKSFNATTKTEFDNSIGKINVIPAEIGRVILNLINNAFYSVNEKQKKSSTGQYAPTVTVNTLRNNGRVEITVGDNGNGIPQQISDKIFQPFFTTKPTGQGTGLGLSMAYEIVKAHGGEIKVDTKEGEGSEFTIQLPASSNIPQIPIIR